MTRFFVGIALHILALCLLLRPRTEIKSAHLPAAPETVPGWPRILTSFCHWHPGFGTKTNAGKIASCSKNCNVFDAHLKVVFTYPLPRPISPTIPSPAAPPMTNDRRRGANPSGDPRARPAVDSRRSAAAIAWQKYKKEAEAELEQPRKAEGRRKHQERLLGKPAAAASAGTNAAPSEEPTPPVTDNESPLSPAGTATMLTMTSATLNEAAAAVVAGNLHPNGDPSKRAAAAPPGAAPAADANGEDAADACTGDAAALTNVDGSEEENTNALPDPTKNGESHCNLGACDHRTFAIDMRTSSLVDIGNEPLAIFRSQNRRLTTKIPGAKDCYLKVLRELIETNTAETNKNYCSDNEEDGIPTLAGTCCASGSCRGVAKPMRELAAAKAQIKTMSEPCLTANREELRSSLDESSCGSSSPSGSNTNSAPAILGGAAMGPSTDVAE